MFSRPALAIFAILAAEVFVLTQAAGVFGFFGTVTLLVGLSVAGMAVLRSTGAGMVQQAASAATGRSESRAIADPAFRFVAGLLLLIPGLVTGALGLLLLLPPVRAIVAPLVRRRLEPLLERSNIVRVTTFGNTVRRRSRSGDGIVDVDIVDIRGTDGSPVDPTQSSDATDFGSPRRELG